MAIEESILKSVKKNLGLNDAYDEFDQDVITHINTAFFVLNQIGVGPRGGFMIEDDDTEWDEFTEGRINLNGVKTFVYLKVRLLFDPPERQHHVDAIEEQLNELLHRLKMDKEITSW